MLFKTSHTMHMFFSLVCCTSGPMSSLRHGIQVHSVTMGSYKWCERCLLITESPKTPGHYRYLIWVLGYIPYTGLAVFSYAISRVPVYTAISIPCEFVFSTLQSRSCWQPTNFCLLRGLKAKCYGYTSCVFVSDWYIFEVSAGCGVR